MEPNLSRDFDNKYHNKFHNYIGSVRVRGVRIMLIRLRESRIFIFLNISIYFLILSILKTNIAIFLMYFFLFRDIFSRHLEISPSSL